MSTRATADNIIRVLAASQDKRNVMMAGRAIMKTLKIDLEGEEIKGYMRYYRFIPQYYESYL